MSKRQSIATTAMLLSSGMHTFAAANDEVNRVLQSDLACISGSFTLELSKQECNYDNFMAAFRVVFDDPFNISPGCTNTAEQDLAIHLGTDLEGLENGVIEACKSVTPHHYLNFEDIPNSDDPNFLQTFYNGGTDWNEHIETLRTPPSDGTNPAQVLKDEAYNVRSYFDGNTGLARNAHLELPDIPNFDLDTCNLNAAMCCYVQDRQADDGNGNCDNGDNNDQYDTLCVDKDPGDNTDLCLVDWNRAPFSNGVGSDGFTVYAEDNDEGEGNIHCHGFAWPDDDAHMYSRYKGNNLFFVSMYDHMYKRGYVRNVPGAPMCGCVEHMPVVSRADCTQTDVIESFRFVRNTDSVGFEGEITFIDIDFNSCQGVDRNNNLENFYQRLVNEGMADSSQLQEIRDNYIVGDHQCDEYISSWFNERGYAAGFADPDWVYIFGRKDLEMPGHDYSAKLFEDAFKARPNAIVRRICPGCIESHRDLFYRRITPLPEGFDLRGVLQSSFKRDNNVLLEDFYIFQTYEDALSNDPTKSFQFCNYDDESHNYGFPFECGVTERTYRQWNSWKRGTHAEAASVAFYLEKEMSFDVNKVPNTKIVGQGFYGSVLEVNNAYYVQGAGYSNYRWDRSDDLMFSNDVTIAGDFTVIGKVSDVDPNGEVPRSSAGLMIRSGLDTSGVMAYVSLSPRYGVVFVVRYEEGEYTYASDYIDYEETEEAVAPEEKWLMLKRVGTIFSAFESDDGVNWIPVGEPRNLQNMSEVAMAGLMATSYSSYPTEAVIHHYEIHESNVVSSLNSSKVSIVADEGMNLVVTENELPEGRIEFVIELVNESTGARRMLKKSQTLI